jgi:opacity protein-like surface antigen
MKRIAVSAVVVAFALFLVMAPVQTAKAADAGPYVGVFGGYVFPEDLEISGGPDIGVDNTWMAGAKFGYICPQYKWFAAELEYNHIFESDLDNFDAKASLDNIFLNFIFRYPVDKWVPYAGLGIGWSWLDLSNGDSESGDDWAWQVLVGVDYKFNPNWSAGIGGRYFQTEPEVGGTDVTYSAWLLTFGVNYHF